ncbi:MEKHLA domain-containing protein [Streptomyces griseorubiginosus]|uniref:MEKHLA domain-containing protein n=1 Tax=Streptomyces griseorubiginosus TaxID=67304 RepID=UPI003640ABCF
MTAFFHDHAADAAPGASEVTRDRDEAFAQLLLSSHQRLAGTALCSSAPGDDLVHLLYDNASFGLLAHDTSPDPVFVYANRTAQQCFGYSWAEFVRLPSRLSAAAEEQADRGEFVRSVTERGYASGYRGLRTAKSGRRFWIENVTMWNLVDGDGTHHGQAAVFRAWRDASETADS